MRGRNDLLELRERLDRLLREKLAQPALEIANDPVVEAIVKLMSTEHAAVS